jgi:hypothetical protein
MCAVSIDEAARRAESNPRSFDTHIAPASGPILILSRASPAATNAMKTPRACPGA